MNKQQRKVALITIGVIAICITSFLLVKRQQTTVPLDTDKETIRIGILKHESSLPIYLADELNIFQKHGLKIKLIELPAGDHLPALISDRVDLISATSFPVLYGVLENHPGLLYAIMPGAEVTEGETLYGIVTRSDFEGKDIHSLKNKKILAINPFTKMNLHNILINIGVKDHEISEIKMANRDAALAAVLDGKNADACIMDQPALAIALNSGNFKLLESNPRAKYISNPYWSGSGAIKKEIWNKDPEKYTIFLQAIDEAILYSRMHSQEAHKILAKRLGLSENIAAEMGGYYFPTLYEEIPLKQMNKTIEALINANLLTKRIDLMNLFPENSYSTIE